MEAKERKGGEGMAGEATAEEILAEAERDGVDLSMLRERLKLTPEERLRRHRQALALVEALREVGRRSRNAPGGSSSDSADPQ